MENGALGAQQYSASNQAGSAQKINVCWSFYILLFTGFADNPPPASLASDAILKRCYLKHCL